jgi:DNA replication protein DnaC
MTAPLESVLPVGVDFKSYLEEVVRACVDCGRIVTMLKITTRCEVCEKVQEDKLKPALEKAAREEQLRRWKSQGIPTRFFGFELSQEFEWALQKPAMIFGDVGTGKSCLGAQIMKKTGGKFITCSSMLDEVQDDNNKMWQFKEHRSLCLDDFTKINPTSYRVEKLFEIFNDRYANDRHTIITCDTFASDVKEAWAKPGEAIVSRIGEWMGKIHMKEKFR